VLFLDEPTLGFDVAIRHSFWEQIRAFVSRGRTVLLTTHYLEEADALADRVIVIDRGRVIADGTPASIKQRVSGRRIRCTTALSEAVVRGIPGVTSASFDGPNAELIVTTAEGVARELLALDAALTNLEVSGVALDEAFLALTTHAQEAA